MTSCEITVFSVLLFTQIWELTLALNGAWICALKTPINPGKPADLSNIMLPHAPQMDVTVNLALIGFKKGDIRKVTLGGITAVAAMAAYLNHGLFTGFKGKGTTLTTGKYFRTHLGLTCLDLLYGATKGAKLG